MEACAIIPQIRNTVTNQIEDSKLYIDLLQYTSNDRKIANDIYYRAINPEFTENYNIDLDERDQPTFESLYKVGELDKYLTDQKELLNIKAGLNLLDDNGNDKEFETQKEAFDISAKFNTNHILKDKYVALPKRIVDGFTKAISYVVEFVKNTFQSKQYQRAHELNNNLRNTIVDKFRNVGISVGSITEVEKRQGVLGVIDFDIAHQTDKLIVEAVRIAEGKAGTEALLEEHIHFLVDVKRNDPLIQRAFNLIRKDGLLQEILGDEYDGYVAQYGENSDKLIYEAIGKLIYEQIKGINSRNQATFLVNRVWKGFQSWATNLTSKNPLSITKVNLYNFTINTYLSPKQQEFLQRTDVNLSGKMYALRVLQNKDTSISEALENAYRLETQRLQINRKQNSNTKQTDSVILLNKLKVFIDRNTPGAIAYGTYNYIHSLSNNVESLQEKYDKAKEQLEGVGSFTPLARAINEIDTFVQMSKPMLKALIPAIKNDTSIDDFVITINDTEMTFAQIKDSLLKDLAEYNQKLSSLHLALLEESKNLLVQFYGKYLNENPSMLESIRKTYEKTYDIKFKEIDGKLDADYAAGIILDKGLTDLGWFSRFGLTASQAPDFFIQLNDDILKQARNKERLDSINDINFLKAHRKLLEQRGTENDKFMFETDKDGKNTGYIISAGHWGTYTAAQTEYFKALDEEYKEGTFSDTVLGNLKYEWYKENTSKDEFGNTIPNPKIYPNPAYTKLSETQKDYHKNLLMKKMALDKKLPARYYQPYLTPQMRQDLYNAVFTSKSIKGGVQNVWKRFQDEFIIRDDETGYGDLGAVTNFENDGYIRTVPIYFTTKLQDMNTLNMDLSGNMMAYAMMVNHYNHFNELADVLVLTKDVLKNRTYAVKNKRNKITRTTGYKSDKEYIKEVIKKHSNTEGKFEHMLDTNIYDVTRIFEGNVGGVNAGKVGDALLKYNSMNKMGFNVLSQITNSLNSRWQTFVEGVGGQVFNLSDLRWADGEFARLMPHMVSEVGQRIKQNKITLMVDFFDVRMDFNSMSTNMNQKNLASKVFDSDMFYMLNNMSEFHAYSTVMLSVAHNNKVFNTVTGKEISLYDAIVLEDVIVNGKKVGKKIGFKKGIVQSKQNQKPIDDLYMHKIGRLMQGLGKDMFGVYSATEKTELNKYFIGRAAYQFRGYFISNLYRRYGKKFYNTDYGMEIEGYYTTLGRLLKNSWKDIIKLNFVAAGKELDTYERANIKKALTELGMFTILAISSMLLGKMGDDDDELEKENWLYNITYYTSARLGSEVGAFLPPTMLLELQRQIASPIPGVSLLEQIGNITSPQKFLRTVKRGYWKDHLYLEQYATYFLPGAKSIITLSDVPTMRDQRRFFQSQGFNFDWSTFNRKDK